MGSSLWLPGLLLAGCATSGGGTSTAPTAEVLPPAIAADKVIDVSALAADRTVCRREVPLGSRISVTTCRSVAPIDAPTDTLREQIVRQEVMDTVRQRQTLLDQQRIERQMMR